MYSLNIVEEAVVLWKDDGANLASQLLWVNIWLGSALATLITPVLINFDA